MAANQYGIDLGEIYRTQAAVEGARTRNKLSGLQLSEMEREIAERPAKETAATERKNLLTGLRQKSVGGDVSAQQQLLALDPEGGAQFIDAITKMDDRKIKATQRSVDEIGQLSGYVLQGKTPEEQQRRYALMYNSVSPEVQSKLPEQYDPQFMELSLSKAMAMDKLLENPKAIQVGGEDVVYKAGREVERKTRPKKDGSGESSAWKGSTSINTMRRLVADLSGKVFNERTGDIVGLTQGEAGDIQAVITEAARLMRKGDAGDEAEAITMAGRKLDIPFVIPDLSGSTVDNNDPLGLR